MTERQNIHATGLVLGRTGIIFRGPSGSGKSLLALTLIDLWEARGQPASLVSDDRVDVEAGRSGLTMYAPPNIGGMIELRGRGIVTRPHVGKAPVRLVVDFVAKAERMVEEEDLVTELLGVAVARCPVPKAGIVELGHQALLVGEAIREVESSRSPRRQKTT
jgi:serine kinase of HPr protein (carbohydrate metabolism regulator)